MTDQPQGPIYEYMMGTFDLHDATWMTSMNDMLNNFGLAGWKRSVVTLLDARHLLVVMERRWPTAAEYAASQPKAEPVADLDPVAEMEFEDTTVARYRKPAAVEPVAEAEASEYDDEAEAMMAAKVAEVIPWAARPKAAPKNGRRKHKVQKKAAVQRSKVMTGGS